MAYSNIAEKSLKQIQEYYGKVLQSNQDLKTNACCTIDRIPTYLQEILKNIDPEIKNRFYGCGSPIPLALEGKTVLDLGSGSGQDCFLLSKLVGERGRVIGIDMTEEQVSLAQKHVEIQTKKFGFLEPNVQFIQGYIEDLESAGIGNSSIDVVISNCVINLSPDKRRVFSEIFRVLKPGGELYFSDVFSQRRIPKQISQDPLFRAECLGGAMYVEDFRRTLFDLECRDYRIMSRSQITLKNAEMEQKLGMLDFYSMTIRAFKLDLEDRCEDYGQVAIYQGGISESENAFVLDDHHTFEKKRPIPVCSNTAAMLQDTRYRDYFTILGNTDTHFGLFDCAPLTSQTGDQKTITGACC